MFIYCYTKCSKWYSLKEIVLFSFTYISLLFLIVSLFHSTLIWHGNSLYIWLNGEEEKIKVRKYKRKTCIYSKKITFLKQNKWEEKINLTMMCGRKENLPDKTSIWKKRLPS